MLLIGTGVISFFFVNVYHILHLSEYDNKITITHVERDRNVNLKDVEFHGYGLKEDIEMVGFFIQDSPSSLFIYIFSILLFAKQIKDQE